MIKSAIIFILYTFSMALYAYAEVVPGEFIIKTKENSKAKIQTVESALLGAKIQVINQEQNMLLVKTQNSKLANGDVIELIKKNFDIDFVQPNFKYRSQLYIAQDKLEKLARIFRIGLITPAPFLPKDPIPNSGGCSCGKDQLIDLDKDIEVIQAADAWQIQKGDSKVVVAVIDTGVDYNHEDLAANIWHSKVNPQMIGWDFVENDMFPYDRTAAINPMYGGGNPGHGTHCAGNIGAVGNNGIGTSGVAQKVSIMPIRMLDENGSGDSAAAISAIDFAIRNGAQIISASWGTEGESIDDELLKQAIERAAWNGILFIAAAGNTSPSEQSTADNDNNPSRRAFPASFDLDNIISVAASNQQGKLAQFSHFGFRSVDLAAPGEFSFSTIPHDRDVRSYPGSIGYESQFNTAIGPIPWSGTSMATPQVAGAAALLWAHFPKMTYIEIKNKILSSVRPEPTLQGKTVSGGVLNLKKLLSTSELF